MVSNQDSNGKTIRREEKLERGMINMCKEFWEDVHIKPSKKFEIVCKKCKQECKIVLQRYMDQGYLPTESRTIIRCENCKIEE